MIKFLTAALVIVLFVLTFELGRKTGLEQATEIVNKNMETLSDRYFEVYGNPSTYGEQCKFDYIIFNDSTECK